MRMKNKLVTDNLEWGDKSQLRKAQQSYRGQFAPEKGLLRQNMGLRWNVYLEI
jgi:hypothetical protein